MPDVMKLDDLRWTLRITLMFFVARSYDNEAEAHFFRIEVDGVPRLLNRADLKLLKS